MQAKFLLIFVLLGTFTSRAQQLNLSPYSSYGIGSLDDFGHPTFTALGGSFTANADSTIVNYMNPASYSRLGKGQPLFSCAFSSRHGSFEQTGLNEKYHSNSINHFALAVPFANRFAWSFGLKPFSKTGYQVNDYQLVNGDSIEYIYRGSGSMNELFTGYSVNLFDIKGQQLSLGAHLSYLFGSSIHQQSASITTASSGGVEERNYQVKSIFYNFGLQYSSNFKYGRNLTLGFTYTPAQQLTASKSSTLYDAPDVSNEQSFSQLSFSKENNSINLPASMALGFAFRFRPKNDSTYNRTRVYQLTLYGDFKSTSWSQYRANFTGEQNALFQDGSSLNVGLEFAPHFQMNHRNTNINYFSRIRYRTGYQQIALPYHDNGIQRTDSGITFGLLFPILSQRSVSSLSIGVKMGQQESSYPESLKEKYLGVHFGVTIAPGVYDRWFRKYKID
ncbi:MAG: hypothetical protein EP338_07795 [Bacteroidetes bacterium]|nr:MAG: hypothetical protein EP338_07795 [Bacteroidota bacterium]